MTTQKSHCKDNNIISPRKKTLKFQQNENVKSPNKVIKKKRKIKNNEVQKKKRQKHKTQNWQALDELNIKPFYF